MNQPLLTKSTKLVFPKGKVILFMKCEWIKMTIPVNVKVIAKMHICNIEDMTKKYPRIRARVSVDGN
jgi:hypothetical protein